MTNILLYKSVNACGIYEFIEIIYLTTTYALRLPTVSLYTVYTLYNNKIIILVIIIKCYRSLKKEKYSSICVRVSLDMKLIDEWNI